MEDSQLKEFSRLETLAAAAAAATKDNGPSRLKWADASQTLTQGKSIDHQLLYEVNVQLCYPWPLLCYLFYM